MDGISKRLVSFGSDGEYDDAILLLLYRVLSVLTEKSVQYPYSLLHVALVQLHYRGLPVVHIREAAGQSPI